MFNYHIIVESKHFQTFLMGKLAIFMAMFNSYVKLPEGKNHVNHPVLMVQKPIHGTLMNNPITELVWWGSHYWIILHVGFPRGFGPW